MGLLILIIVIVAVIFMVGSEENTENSNSTYENRMIGNLPTGNTYGLKEVMYVVGCISYYATLYGADIMVMAGMPSKDAETGTFVSISVDNLSIISRFFPKDLKQVVDSITWTIKSNEKLRITFSMNKTDYMNMRNDCIQAYRNGIFAAKSVEMRSGLTPKPLYVIAHPHMYIIDNSSHSSGDVERIL